MPPRRPQSKQKLPNKQALQKKPLVMEDDQEAVEKFKVELQWCVQQLEASMKKTSPKEKEDMAKAHRTLTSSKAAHIKKRQVMNSLFGDYRSKMAEEESKLKIEVPKMKKQSVIPNKSVFHKKSANIVPTTTSEPLPNSQDADEKNQAAEGIDQNLPGIESSSVLNTKELNKNKDDITNTSEKDFVGNVSEGNAESKKTATSSFKFPTQSGSEFKFNFSAVS